MIWSLSGEYFVTFPMPAGDQTDELVFQFPTPLTPSASAVLTGFDLSAEGPAFGWSLYFAPAAAAAAENTVIVDSRADSSMPITPVQPVGADVVNLTMNCDRIVPRQANVPMALRVTTTGKTGVGNLRFRWAWADPG